jgi:hypothetical protein
MVQIPINIDNPMQDLQHAIAAVTHEGRGTKFTVQPFPQPGQGCRERFLGQHGYANGVPISKTEVAVTLDGQIVLIHPRFRWDDVDERRRKPITLRDVLGAIFGADAE